MVIVCLGKYYTLSNKLSLRFDKLVDQRIISGWLNNSPIRLFSGSTSRNSIVSVHWFPFFLHPVPERGFPKLSSQNIEEEKTFPQNSVRMANFPAEQSPDKRDITVHIEIFYVFHTLLQTCQLSRIIRESHGFKAPLPHSRISTESQRKIIIAEHAL